MSSTSHHTINDLFDEITKYTQNPTKSDLNKLLVDCHHFIHSKGIQHSDTQKLATKLATLDTQLISKKQINSLFDAESEDILSLHFKQQRTTKQQKEEYKKMIKQKAKSIMLIENQYLDSIDPLETPITPSSPRFSLYYDFVYIPELVSYIFQFLDTRPQCKMKRVCQLWSKIADDELLWKMKFIDSYTIYEGDNNYNKESSIIEFKKKEEKKKKKVDQQDAQFKNWKDLCVMSDENEKRHFKNQKPIILNSFSNDKNDSYDHYNRLFCCRFSQDGNYLISGGQSSTVQVLKTTDLMKNSIEEYDSDDDEEEEEISSHRTLLEFLQGRIRLSNLPKDKRPKEKIKIHSKIPANDVGWSVLDVDISKDNKFVTYSTWKNYVPLIPMNNPKKRTEILLTDDDEYRFCVFSVRFSPSGKEMLAGCSDGTLYISDVESQQCVAKCLSSNNDLNSVSFGGDGYDDVLFTGGDDCICKIWDRRLLDQGSKNKPIGVLIGHKYGITSVGSKGDGITYISSSKDQCIKLWDIRKLSGTDSGILKLKSVQDSLNPLHWDYRYPEVLPKDKLVQKNPYDKSIMTYAGHHQVFKTLIRCDFSPAYSTGQKYIYTGSSDGNVVLYNTLTGKLEQKVTASTNLIREVTWHPFLPILISASWDTKLSAISYKGENDSISFIQSYVDDDDQLMQENEPEYYEEDDYEEHEEEAIYEDYEEIMDDEDIEYVFEE